QRRDRLLPTLDQLALLHLQRAEPADPGADHAADPVRLIRERVAARPPSLLDRLLRGGDCQLGEAVGAPRLLLGEQVKRVEVAAAADAVLDPARAGAPALDQGVAADPERGNGADARYHDPPNHPALATTRSITSPTVFTSLTSSPRSSTPNSSSMIWASSTRS